MYKERIITCFREVSVKRPTAFFLSSLKTWKHSAQLFQGVPALPGGSGPGAASGTPDDSF